MVHLLPTKAQRVKETKKLIEDLTALIEKANAEGRHWTAAQYLRLKETIVCDLNKMV